MVVHRARGAGHGSAEDTRASHCNSMLRLSCASTQLAPCACFAGCATKQAPTRTAMHTEWLSRRNWVAAFASVSTRRTEGRGSEESQRRRRCSEPSVDPPELGSWTRRTRAHVGQLCKSDAQFVQAKFKNLVSPNFRSLEKLFQRRGAGRLFHRDIRLQVPAASCAPARVLKAGQGASGMDANAVVRKSTCSGVFQNKRAPMVTAFKGRNTSTPPFSLPAMPGRRRKERL